MSSDWGPANDGACESCEHVLPSTRRQSYTQWLCTQQKRRPGGVGIAPSTAHINEPYMRCTGVSGGLCPMWERRRGDGEV